MAVMKKGDVEIYYEEHGGGIPVLCFAPGSLRSHIDYWHCSPKRPTEPPTFLDPTVDLAGDFHVIAMDQRNAGRSRAPVRATDGWDTYAQDHIALMDHLGIGRFHVLGACIGASFCLKLAELMPGRIMSAVLLQPIGRVPENIAYTKRETAENWGLGMCKTNPTIDLADIIAMGERMFTPEFVHCVTREFVGQCTTPMLLMPGDDMAHPASISDEVLSLAPRIEYLRWWKNEGRKYSALVARDFLRRNTPAP
jgi:pimeloyl-ACP methyl ester carboxylesterase